MPGNTDFRPHLYVGPNGKASKYTYPREVVIIKNIPERNRNEHWANLRAQLHQVIEASTSLAKEAEEYELELSIGVQVAFDSFPEAELEVEKLADANHAIELLNVNT
ncbi:conserved hypothetical protein, partial [Ricinus communis]